MTAFLGIDFGTTNSCVAVYHRDRPLIVPSLEGRPATPSCVSFDDLGQPIVGSAARKRLPLAPERTIVGVKRLLGRRFDELGEHEREALPYRLRAGARGEIRIVLDEGSVDEGRSEWSITPEEAATHIFARLRADAEAWLGRRTVACVLTVPAYFNNLQRQALRLAASSAGLEVQRLLNEPTAAALAYGLRADDDLSRRILVCDLGGGTFDVSLLAIEDRSFRVLATSGDPFLGGRDLDQLLADALRGEFLANLDESLADEFAADPLVRQRFLEAAEEAKIDLSYAVESRVSIPFVLKSGETPRHFESVVRRETLESLARPFLERLETPIERCLAQAAIAPREIDGLLLVGAMTRMPLIADHLTRFLDVQLLGGVSPDEAVALGAAVECAALAGAVEGLALYDIAPLSLGVEIEGGLTKTLIPAGSLLPARSQEIFTTSRDRQSSVALRILQGEHGMARENVLLGKLQLRGLPRRSRGETEVEVTFNLDESGLLEVSAREKSTGKEVSSVIHAPTLLAAEEVAAIRERAERFLLHDRLRSQIARVRLFLHRLETQGCVVPQEEALRERLALLEDALRDSDPRTVASLARELEETLSSLEAARL